MELALDEMPKQTKMIIWQVSILVFVELALDANIVIREVFTCTFVSILVFVELALDEDPKTMKHLIEYAGFNPCFRGTCS